MSLLNVIWAIYLGLFSLLFPGLNTTAWEPGNTPGGGIFYRETDTSGKFIRYVVFVKMYVVTVSPPRRYSVARKARRVSSRYSSSDVQKIHRIAHGIFNGPQGEGAINLLGERVYFDFQVEEYHIGEDIYYSEMDLMEIGNIEGTESGQMAFRIDGKPVYYRAPLNFILCGLEGKDRGKNNGVITNIRYEERYNPDVILHETLHQLLTRGTEMEHKLGGGLSTPPGCLTPANVSAILEDALPARVFERKITQCKR